LKKRVFKSLKEGKGRPLKLKGCKMMKSLVQRRRGMKKYTSLLLSLLIGFNGTCGYEEGIEAFERGDYEKASLHFVSQITQGDTRSKAYLAAMNEEEEPDAEIAQYLESSESTGQLNKHFRNAFLSRIYLKRGTEELIEKGVGLLYTAANLGKSAYASYILGKVYLGGIGQIPKDEEEGILYLRKAIQLNGHQKSKKILEEQERLSREVWEMHHREVAGAAAAADAESQVTFETLGWERGSKYTDIREDGVSIISKLTISTDKILEENPTGIARSRGGEVSREQIIARCQKIARVSSEASLGKRESLQALIRHAEEGDHLAEAYLAVIYSNDEGGAVKDARISTEYAKKALSWLMKESAKGNAYAQYSLGFMYENGLGVAKDDQEAVRWYRLAADQGDANAQFALGVMYKKGQGTVKDDREAVRLYRLSANQGHARAQYTLGARYEYGLGVTKDYREAVRWYRLSADQGFAVAQNSLGKMYNGGIEVAYDRQVAVRLYRLAADQGYADAQYNLGSLYAHGQWDSRDYQEAAKWYTLAANQGHDDAQLFLGRMYMYGEGVSRDEKEAAKWFRLAADQGNGVARYELEKLQARRFV
jgi:TPR repeat protein